MENCCGGIFQIVQNMKYEINKQRAFSWSQIASWEYDPEQWFERYVIGKKQEESSAMAFGKLIGEQYPYEPTFVREYKIQSRLGDIRLIGYIDAFDLKNQKLIELKTGRNWDLKKAQNHGQLDLYCAMLFAQHKIHPADLDIKLVWLATEEDGDFSTKFIKDMKPVIFPIKKSMVDVLNMLARVKRTYAQMLQYVDKYNLQHSDDMLL
jgi:hypothetical protein